MSGNELADWINPEHLSEAAQAAAAGRFASDPYDCLWLDDFLLPGRLDSLRDLFRQDGLFLPWFGLYGASKDSPLTFVDKAAFAAAPPERKFEEETVMRGPRPGREMSRGYLTHLKFLHFLAQPAFLGFLERLTGINPGGVHSCQVRISEPGHYVGPHKDSGRGRELCMVLYPGERWHPRENGHLIQFHPDGRTRKLEPRPNRLMMFRVSDRSVHAVEPVTLAPRWGYTVWMGRDGGES